MIVGVLEMELRFRGITVRDLETVLGQQRLLSSRRHHRRPLAMKTMKTELAAPCGILYGVGLVQASPP